jgi:hypothetical protein
MTSLLLAERGWERTSIDARLFGASVRFRFSPLTTSKQWADSALLIRRRAQWYGTYVILL